MNLAKINEIRAQAGLTALVSKADPAAKRRQLANRAMRAEASRELKSLRNSGRKAK